MEKVIVLGIGNRLMMDDGIGIYLVEELAKLDGQSNIDYMVGESDVDYCLNQIEGATLIIILDAICSGKKEGYISIYSLTNLHEYHTLDISPHNLHLFQALYQQKETIRGYIIGVEPYEIGFHIGLSKRLDRKWNQIIQRVKKAIKLLLEEEKKEGL